MDYRWYESLDVRLYGSFGLLMLWSRLEKAVLEAFARAIPQGDETPASSVTTRLKRSERRLEQLPTISVHLTNIPGKKPTTLPTKTATSGKIYRAILSCKCIGITC